MKIPCVGGALVNHCPYLSVPRDSQSVLYSTTGDKYYFNAHTRINGGVLAIINVSDYYLQDNVLLCVCVCALLFRRFLKVFSRESLN